MRYPLVLDFGGLVAGKGFIARVDLRSRALVEEETGDVWFYGVNPGGVAADGPTRSEAYHAFVDACQSVVLDIADASGSFDEFKAAVERFFHETNEPTEAEWKKAVQEVRSGELTVEGLTKKVGSADRPPAVEVTLVEEPSPAANPQPNNQALAA